MNSTYHTTYQYHFCLGENLLRGDGAQSCLSVCHQSSLSSPLSSPLLYWLRHQCWQIIQSGDDAAFRQSVIFPNNCANKPSLSALSCSLQPDPSNQVMWLTSPTIYRHVSGVLFFGYQLYTHDLLGVYKFNNNNNNQTLSENSKANLVNFLNKIKSKEPEGGKNIRDCF